MLAACNEKVKQEAEKTVLQKDGRIDSLQLIIDQKDNELNDIVGMFNEIQDGFRLIEESERSMSLLRDDEGTLPEDKAEKIRQSIKTVQQRMQQNRELILRLQQQVREGSTHSDELKRTIDNFVKELEIKNDELQKLRAQLEEKDVHIAELDKAVKDLNGDVENLKEETAKKSETIVSQEKQMNTAWYVFGTKKELEEQRIYAKGRILDKDFNKNYFTKVDIRVDKEVKLYSKSAELLSSHPAGSYTLQQDAQKQYVLRITNPQAFWSTSRYLVVMVK